LELNMGNPLAIGIFCACLAVHAAAPAGYADMKPDSFRKMVDGKQVDLFTIQNQRGMVVKVTNYGAKVEQVLVPDRNGRLGDVVLGYDSLDGVMGGQASMNAFIGRYANRIGGGTFTLDGVAYHLAINDSPRPNTLHGGKKGSRFCVFEARQLSSSSLEMDYTFKDGEEGFPGALELKVVYTVTDQNELRYDYTARALDRKTIGSFTTHLFFNLSGQGGSSILDHDLTLQAGRVLEADLNLCPTGVLRDVAGAPMDFRKPKAIGRDFGADYDLLKAGPGYDHAWIIDKRPGEFGLLAKAADPKSGRTLEVYSTEPAVQFYSGNFLEGKAPRDLGKDGDLYVAHSGFCLEPGHYPDSPNHPQFPSTVIEPGKPYSGKIVYKFGIQN
jgi:aldose 1-epimerase